MREGRNTNNSLGEFGEVKNSVFRMRMSHSEKL